MLQYLSPNHVVQDVLETLNKSNIFEDNAYSIHLLDGSLSAALFYAEHYDRYKEIESLNRCNKLIQIALKHCNTSNQLIGSFSSGIAGLAWVMQYLEKKSYLTFDPSYYPEFDESLEQLAHSYLDQSEYDYMHGALGIGLYFILSENKRAVTNILLKLYNSSEENIYGKYWKKIDHYQNLKTNQYEINFGMSHGIPSVLQFAIYAYKSSIENSISLKIIKECYKLLLNVLEDSSKEDIVFPSSMIFEGDILISKQESRLAWCYGDLTIFNTLLSCCEIIGDSSNHDKILNLCAKLSEVKDPDITKLRESNVCHGFFGVSHIYNKLYLTHKLSCFKSAADYWWKKGINDIQNDNPLSNYEQFFMNKQKRKSFGILTGISGIGLVGLSRNNDKIFSGSVSWDNVLML